MEMQKVFVGILGDSRESCNSLAARVEQTRLASQKIFIDQYCLAEDDGPTQRLLKARPEVVLVDLEKQRPAIQSLFTLHAVLPETWLLACGPSNDPQLIIEAMQAGAREFLPKPVLAPALVAAFGRCLSERQRLCSDVKPRGKVYCVTSAKGGTGATSVAINIAATLSHVPDRHIAVLDLTIPLGDAAGYLNLKPRFSVAEAVAAATKLDSALLETYMERAGNVSVLAGIGQLKASPATVGALSRLIKVVVSSYNDIVIDCPSTVGPEFLQAVIDASTAVLVVTTPELLAVSRTHRLLNLLESWRCGDRLRLILNREDRRSSLDAKAIERALGRALFWKLPNNYHAAAMAINQGKPIAELNHSGLAASYHGLTEQLTGVVLRKQRSMILRLTAAKSPRQSEACAPILDA